MSSPASQATGTPQPFKLGSWLDAFEKVAKALVLLVAVAYALGLIVSMQHLMSLGISDFSSLRPRYIATGFWTLLLFLLASFPALLPSVAVITSQTPFTRRAAVATAFLFAVAIGLSLSFQNNLLKALGVTPRHFVPGGVVSLTYTTSLLILACLWLWADSHGRRSTRAYLLLISLYIIPLWCFLAARDYIQKIYVQVPDALGGGKPMSAELILNKDGVAVWRETGIPLANPSDSTKTARVKILYQSDQEVVVSATYQDGKETKEKTVIMKKSLVDGILPLSDDKR